MSPTGKLEAVSQLKGSQSNSSQAEFIWSEPYSLEGTVILGYQVDLVIGSSLTENELVWKTMNVSKTNCSVSKPSTVVCAYINISIRAMNDAGLGEPATAIFKFIESNQSFTVLHCFVIGAVQILLTCTLVGGLN